MFENCINIEDINCVWMLEFLTQEDLDFFIKEREKRKLYVLKDVFWYINERAKK